MVYLEKRGKMSIKDEYESLLNEVKSEFSDFEILAKNRSVLMKFIDAALHIITFGQMKNFMTGFITTMGNKVYVPDSWEMSSITNKIEIIRHERVHMRQAKKYTRPLFSLLYLIVPFPIGVSYFRKKFEQEAYEESMRALHEYHGEKIFTPRLKEVIIDHFMSAQYFWMWPWRGNLEKWYDLTVQKILSGN